jgi:hypothetical protein
MENYSPKVYNRDSCEAEKRFGIYKSGQRRRYSRGLAFYGEKPQLSYKTELSGSLGEVDR